MNKFLVKFFYYADMLFMTFFIVAAFGIKVKWLSVASTVALLLFGCRLCRRNTRFVETQRTSCELPVHLRLGRSHWSCGGCMGICRRLVELIFKAYE